MKRDSIVYIILEKREKFGYISYIDPKDKNKLTELFNIIIEKLYDNLLLYLNEMTVSEIYPMVHNYLYQVLVDSIIKEVEPSLFKLVFCDHIEYILEKTFKTFNIDIFSNDYILSKGNFNDIQLFMLRNNIFGIIANNNYNSDVISRRDYVCKKLGISKLKYNVEALKMTKELLRIFKEEEKEKNVNKL